MKFVSLYFIWHKPEAKGKFSIPEYEARYRLKIGAVDQGIM
jgi:hypothetical protein